MAQGEFTILSLALLITHGRAVLSESVFFVTTVIIMTVQMSPWFECERSHDLSRAWKLSLQLVVLFWEVRKLLGGRIYWDWSWVSRRNGGLPKLCNLSFRPHLSVTVLPRQHHPHPLKSWAKISSPSVKLLLAMDLVTAMREELKHSWETACEK